MSATEADDRVARLRVLARWSSRPDSAACRRSGCSPRCSTTYDRAGGGLVAGGLAYSALIALLPGLLLVAVRVRARRHRPGDPGAAGRLRSPTAFPPLEDFVGDRPRAGLGRRRPERDHRVRRPAVGVEPLLLGARLRDRSQSSARPSTRNEIVRTLRGVLLTLLLVAFPIMVVFAGTVVQALLDLIPDANTRTGDRRTCRPLAARRSRTFAAVRRLATVMVYRYVPAERVPARAWRRPAIVVGLAARRVHPGVRVHRAADDPDLGALRGDRRGVRAARVAVDRLQHAADRRRVDAGAGLGGRRRPTRRRPTSRTGPDASEVRAP